MLPRVMRLEMVSVPSGGARSRSGPAPDPNALRRDRKDDAAWITLPSEGYAGAVPDFPLDGMTVAEGELWGKLWRKPQAVMWAKLGLEFEVGAYVRAFLESVEPEASAGLKTAVLRMAAEIGLSLPGMHQLRWKFAADELADRRAAVSVSAASSVRSRLGAVSGGR